MDADETGTDVVIIGSGMGGLTAALFAAKAGLSCVVLEKTDLIGGLSAWSYGATWIGTTQDATDAGLPDSLDKVMDYLTFLGGGENDPRRTETFARGVPHLLAALREAGLGFDLLPGINDLLSGRAPGAAEAGRTFEPSPIDGRTVGPQRAQLRTTPGTEEWRLPRSVIVLQDSREALAAAIAQAAERDQLAQGPGLVAQLLRALQPFGVPVLTGCAADRLMVADGRVAGVSATDGRCFRARKAVILATGNYGFNRALVAELDKVPEYQVWAPPGLTGDGLRLASEAGAAIRETRDNRGVFLGFKDPSDPEGTRAGMPSTRELSRAHAILVNRAGRRFSNEGFFQDTALTLRRIDPTTRAPANVPCWMVFDATYADRWGLCDAPPGNVPDWVVTAPDIATLAREAGIDPDGLAATVERFNGFAESGVDEDFGRAPGWKLAPVSGAGKNPALGSIARAPFHAARLYPTLGIGGFGIKTDEAGRAGGWRGGAVPGLYAVGDVALHDEFGTGYQAGITSAATMYFAYAAVRDIAGTA